MRTVWKRSRLTGNFRLRKGGSPLPVFETLHCKQSTYALCRRLVIDSKELIECAHEQGLLILKDLSYVIQNKEPIRLEPPLLSSDFRLAISERVHPDADKNSILLVLRRLGRVRCGVRS